MRLNLKETNGKSDKITARFDKFVTAAKMPSTVTNATAYTITATTGSYTTTTNECIFARTIKVYRKVREKNFNIFSRDINLIRYKIIRSFVFGKVITKNLL